MTEPAGTDPQARLAEAVRLIERGDEEAARRTLDALEPELPDACRVERCLLDLRDQRPVGEILANLDDVLERADDGSDLRARALHVKGRVLARTADTAGATGALLESLEAYEAAGREDARARVYDTLGMVFAFEGQLEPALSYYAISLTEKLLAGDRAGAALSLGQIGRLQLRAGRACEARRCFELDLRLATEVDDPRGCAQMWNDIARTYVMEDRATDALEALDRCLALADAHPLEEIAVFAHKDRALALTARACGDDAVAGDLEAARDALQSARQLLEGREDPFAAALLDHVEGRLLAAQGDAEAAAVLLRSAEQLQALHSPDFEVPVLLDLAAALKGQGKDARAHTALARALSRARHDGLARHFAPIREAMAALDLAEGATLEEGRLDLTPDEEPVATGYADLAKLGEGVFGTVYRALDLRRGREVAIKRLRLDALYDPADRRVRDASIRVELEATARVRHPGVARVHAIGTDSEGQTYVVQDFVRGRPLTADMAEATMPPVRDVVEAGRDIAYALAALHEAGVVHRDLKPANVMMDASTDRPVLIDMGVAYAPTNPAAFDDHAFVGSLAYMAPEQAAGKAVDGRADVYALGVLLYEWLTGFRPLRVKPGTAKEVARQLRQEEPGRLRGLRSDVPDPVAALVHRMLEKSRRKRPMAHEAARALEQLASELPEAKA